MEFQLHFPRDSSLSCLVAQGDVAVVGEHKGREEHSTHLVLLAALGDAVEVDDVDVVKLLPAGLPSLDLSLDVV